MFKNYLAGINSRGVVLASGSAGRKTLCEKLGLDFTVQVSGFPEDRDWRDFESPEDYAMFNAAEKIKMIESEKIVIAADTVVCLGKEVFEKPSDREDLKRMMRELGGKTHVIMTAVIVKGVLDQRVVDRTLVTMDDLSEDAIENLANTPEEWVGHAGGYSIDGKLGCTIFKGINGSYYNVIGMPIHQLAKLLINEQDAYLKTNR